MNDLQVAEDTYAWLVTSGRLSAEGIKIVEQMGLDQFLQRAAEEWAEVDRPMYMNGMKLIMAAIIWPE